MHLLTSFNVSFEPCNLLYFFSECDVNVSIRYMLLQCTRNDIDRMDIKQIYDSFSEQAKTIRTQGE